MDQNDLKVHQQVRTLWHARWFILGTTLCFAVIAIGAAFTVSKRYEGVVQLSPVSPDKGGSLSAGSSEMAGVLGTLAGISLGSESEKSEAIAILQSESLTDEFILKNNLLPVFYSDDWDAGTKSWKTAKAAHDDTLWMANRFFSRKIRKIATNAKSGLLTMTITWRDAKTAALWANELVRMANDRIRDRAIEEAERNIAYLTEQAEKTNVVEMRQVIFTIMQKELTKAMVARGAEEYAFKVIDPATIPERPSYPNKAIWIFAGSFTGLLLSISVVSIRANLKTNA